MYKLGIDASLTGTGLALFDPKTNIVISSTIKPKGKRGAERLAYIETEFLKFISGKAVDAAAIEGYSYGSKNGKVFELGECGGIFRKELFKAGIPFIVVAPSSLKKRFTGDGRADKKKMLQACMRIGYKPANHNEADAIALSRVA